MKITVTKGMEGRKVEAIDLDCKTAKKAFKEIEKWKNAHASSDKYRVMHYNRVLFLEKKHRLVIDFGDYQYFILVACNAKEWEDIEKWHSRPVDLTV